MVAPTLTAGKALTHSRLVGVADAVDASEVGGLDVGHGIADERALGWFCFESFHGLGDQVRAGLEEPGVGAGPGDDEADPVVQAVAGEVGVDGPG